MKGELDRGIVDQSAVAMRVATFAAGVWLTYVVCGTSAVYAALSMGGARAVESATGAQRPTVIANGPGTCRRAADYAPLARLPRGLVLGFIDAGPFVLLEKDATNPP